MLVIGILFAGPEGTLTPIGREGRGEGARVSAGWAALKAPPSPAGYQRTGENCPGLRAGREGRTQPETHSQRQTNGCHHG